MNSSLDTIKSPIFVLLESFLAQTSEASARLGVDKAEAYRRGDLDAAGMIRSRISELDGLEALLLSEITRRGYSQQAFAANLQTLEAASEPASPTTDPAAAEPEPEEPIRVSAEEVLRTDPPATEPDDQTAEIAETEIRPLTSDFAVIAAPVKQKSKPKPGQDLKDLRDTFFVHARELEGVDVEDPVRRALVKSLVCTGRALIEVASEDHGDLIWAELRHLSGSFRPVTDLTDFFGWKSGRLLSSELWLELSELYRRLAAAEEAWGWLKSEPEISELDRKSVFDACAACEANLYRVISERVPGAVDAQQLTLHKSLDQVNHDYITHWDQLHTLEEIAKVAQTLEPKVAKLKEGISARQSRQANSSALKELSDWVASPGQGEDFLTGLEERVVACLESGVKEKNKQLVKEVLPFREMLKDRDPRLARLLEVVRREETKIFAERQSLPNDDLEDIVDPEHEARLKELAGYLKGKTVLFVGGRKGQGQRAAMLERELGLKKLIWFDAEEGTHVARLGHDVKHADVVCQLIRWSRHSYKGILDDAKAQGKQIAWLPTGLGINRVVYDLHKQLCRNGVPDAVPA